METLAVEDTFVATKKDYDSAVEHSKIFDLSNFLTNDSFGKLPKHSGRHYLTSGAVYKGIQRSDRKDYEVKVDIKVADFERPLFCGYLTIYNLTDGAASLTTFFEAEIVGRSGNTFLTSKWETSSEIDHGHWVRPFYSLIFSPNFRSSFSTKRFSPVKHLSTMSVLLTTKKLFLCAGKNSLWFQTIM